MDLPNVKFFSICFLDSLALGLFLPILSTHITTLGGNHTILGILASLYAFVRLFSSSIIYSLSIRFGKKNALMLSLLINYFIYFPFGTTSSYVTIIMLRLIIALSNQTQNVCNLILSDCTEKRDLIKLSSILNFVSAIGLCIGPLIGGTVFDQINGFYCLSRLAGTFLFISLIITMTLPPSEPKNKVQTDLFVTKVKKDMTEKFGKLTYKNLIKEWDLVVFKFLHSISAVVFFMKFSMMLKIHYQLSMPFIGCAYAYQGVLTFLAPFVNVFIQLNYNNIHVCMLVAFTLTLIGLCFAVTFHTYLLCFVPMILMHTFLNVLWKKLCKQRSNKDYNIEGIDDAIGEVASITVPCVFGIFCDFYGLIALKTFVILPILLNIIASIIAFNHKKSNLKGE
ncbi:hypothetical protein FQA39_LY11764 [Lamprigera yunnana]|nr:hypothetical protein FQA39_LY11764 [Lamprigera yunnana]